MENKSEGDMTTEAVKVLNECVKMASNIPSRKSKEQRRSETKETEQITRYLNANHSTEEKLAMLTKKYFEVVDENRKNQTLCKQWERQSIVLQKERDQTQAEYNKTVLVKSKLENLCRELQKQIKIVKEESLLKIKEEGEKHSSTFALYQDAMKDLSSLIDKNNERNLKLRDSNLDMKEKFKHVLEQYETREKHIEKITKQMQLESQLAEAKLAKANLEAQADKEKLMAEKKQLLTDLTMYQARCTELQATAATLHSQIAMYTNKYDEFQTLLSRSNEVFGGVKGEMEKVSQQVEKQEKEALIWKQRWEKSHHALLDMAAEKQKTDAAYALQERQLSRLQNICRTLQVQRTALLNTLKDNNIETPTLPQAPPPEPSDKVDILAANCAQLKQSLSQLQGQLNEITSKKKVEPSPPQETAAAANNVPKKSKKNKNKKNKLAKEENDEAAKAESVTENPKVDSVVENGKESKSEAAPKPNTDVEVVKTDEEIAAVETLKAIKDLITESELILDASNKNVESTVEKVDLNETTEVAPSSEDKKTDSLPVASDVETVPKIEASPMPELVAVPPAVSC